MKHVKTIFFLDLGLVVRVLPNLGYRRCVRLIHSWNAEKGGLLLHIAFDQSQERPIFCLSWPSLGDQQSNLLLEDRVDLSSQLPDPFAFLRERIKVGSKLCRPEEPIPACTNLSPFLEPGKPKSLQPLGHLACRVIERGCLRGALPRPLSESKILPLARRPSVRPRLVVPWSHNDSQT